MSDGIIVAIIQVTGIMAQGIYTKMNTKKTLEDSKLNKLTKEIQVTQLRNLLYPELRNILQTSERPDGDHFEYLALLYEQYQELGGNGMVHKMWENVKELMYDSNTPK